MPKNKIFKTFLEPQTAFVFQVFEPAIRMKHEHSQVKQIQ